MAYVKEEEIGGIRVAARAVPGWLIAFAVVVFTLATWYLLSFSSTDSSTPGPGAPAPGAVEADRG